MRSVSGKSSRERANGRAIVGALIAALALSGIACGEPSAKAPDDASPQHASAQKRALAEPPRSFHDEIWTGEAQVTRAYYDDTIAVYIEAGVDPARLTWMYGYARQAWEYVRSTYGSLGPDPRLYIVVHSNRAIEEATISTHSGDGFGLRNVIDLGTAWDWSTPDDGGLEVFTHELAHLVEWGSKNVRNSPSYGFWGDGPWPAIFVYDVYKALGHDDWAAAFRDEMLHSTNESLLPALPGEHPFFASWFYPLYVQYGEARLLDRYFSLLAECFPKREQLVHGKLEQHYERDATLGEVVHFWSGATGENLTARFAQAFGWSEEMQRQLEDAQRALPCADNYPH